MKNFDTKFYRCSRSMIKKGYANFITLFSQQLFLRCLSLSGIRVSFWGQMVFFMRKRLFFCSSGSIALICWKAHNDFYCNDQLNRRKFYRRFKKLFAWLERKSLTKKRFYFLSLVWRYAKKSSLNLKQNYIFIM